MWLFVCAFADAIFNFVKRKHALPYCGFDCVRECVRKNAECEHQQQQQSGLWSLVFGPVCFGCVGSNSEVICQQLQQEDTLLAMTAKVITLVGRNMFTSCIIDFDRDHTSRRFMQMIA